MRFLAASLFLAGAILSSVAADSSSVGKAIEAPGPWVESLREQPGALIETNAVNGLRIALLDQQHNGATAELYQHVIRELVNENGVQNGARVAIDFDPDYQSLVWHHVRIHRQGQIIDCLDAAKIKVIQMESDLERHVYNGALSAVIFIEGARIGDRIDFAYTVRGANPILEGRLASSFLLQYGIPIRELRYRLIWPSDRRLWFKSFGVERQPVTAAKGAFTEYTWHERDLPAANFEEGCPLWAHPLPWVQLTEFGLWSEVAAWANRLYPAPGSLPESLRDKINQWRNLPDKSDAVRAALEFVQDEIRYLGFEAGTGSHLPSAPSEVFSRRFGDCKDKTYLLVSILHELGVTATPALVHTGYRQELANFLPSPFAFNHVIARVELGGKRLYLDPTRSFARGPLEERSANELFYCLPTASNVVTLERLPVARHNGGIAIYETYRISQIAAPALLTVRSVFSGPNADSHRAYLASITAEQHQKRCLDYYAKLHTKIEQVRPIEIRDDPASNRIEISEQYSIPAFWRPAQDKARHECEFYPYEISAALKRPAGTRTKPWLTGHPLSVSVRTDVHLPENWPADNKFWGETNSALEFAASRSVSGTMLVMNYAVRTLADHVPADQAPDHAETTARALDSLGYKLYWGQPAQAGGPLNWPMIALTLMGAGLSAVGAAFYYRRLGHAAPPIAVDPLVPDSRLQGIGGWLILVAIAVILRPFVQLGSLSNYTCVFKLAEWNSLTAPGGSSYNAIWAPVLLFDLAALLALGAVAILQAFLFFQKRRAFPRIFIFFLAAAAVLSAIDCVAIQAVAASDTSRHEAFRDLFRSLIGCAVWIPYMLCSVRVRATFTR